MRKISSRIAAAVTAAATAGSMLLAVAPVHAAQITSMSHTLNRQKVSVASVQHGISFTLPGATDGELTIILASGFTSLADSSAVGTCASGTILDVDTSATNSITAWLSGCSGAVTIGGASTTQITATNPGTEGSYTTRIYAGGTGHIDQSSAEAAATHTGSMAVAITDEDQVTVMAAVDPSITFEVGATHEFCNTSNTIAGGTVNLGVIPTSGTFRASKGTTTFLSGLSGTVNHICTRVSTNATSGYVITVDSANGALASTSTPADLIPSTAQTGPAFVVNMAAGTPSYGLCVGSASNEIGVATTTPAGASATGTAPFNAACDNNLSSGSVGALTTDTNQILSNSGPVSQGWATLYIKAAAGAMTEAHTDYADTLTFIATATF